MKYLIEITKSNRPKSAYQVKRSFDTLNEPKWDNGGYIVPCQVAVNWQAYNIGNGYKARLVFVDDICKRKILLRKGN